MALLAGTGLFILERVLPHMNQFDKMLSIARMDMCWSIDDITSHCQRLNLDYDENVAIKLKSQEQCLYTSKEFYELLKFKHYDDIDYFADTNCTIVHDMNNEIDEQYHQQYDLVIEVGTLEHIFDQRNALSNMAYCLKPGGIVCHLSPMDSFNHGFYNYSINLFHDFYTVNQFDHMEFYLMRHPQDFARNQNVVYHQLPYTPDELIIGPEISESEYNRLGIAFIGRKAEHVYPSLVPMQGAYDPTKKVGQLRQWHS